MKLTSFLRQSLYHECLSSQAENFLLLLAGLDSLVDKSYTAIQKRSLIGQFQRPKVQLDSAEVRRKGTRRSIEQTRLQI